MTLTHATSSSPDMIRRALPHQGIEKSSYGLICRPPPSHGERTEAMPNNDRCALASTSGVTKEGASGKFGAADGTAIKRTQSRSGCHPCIHWHLHDPSFPGAPCDPMRLVPRTEHFASAKLRTNSAKLRVRLMTVWQPPRTNSGRRQTIGSVPASSLANVASASTFGIGPLHPAGQTCRHRQTDPISHQKKYFLIFKEH